MEKESILSKPLTDETAKKYIEQYLDKPLTTAELAQFPIFHKEKENTNEVQQSTDADEKAVEESNKSTDSNDVKETKSTVENLTSLSLVDLKAYRDQLLVSKKAAMERYVGSDDRDREAAMKEALAIVKKLQVVNDRIEEILNPSEFKFKKAEKERQDRERAETQTKYEQLQAEREKKLQAEREKKHQAELQAKLEKETAAKKIWTDFESKLHKRFEETAQEILNTLENFQVTPSTECVEMNDKLIKLLFNHGTDDFERIINGKKFSCIEKRARVYKGKKKDAIVSWYKLKNAEGYDNKTPLDEFDRAVLGVIFSEISAGNLYTTVNIIHRALIGKVGEVAIVPYKNQKESIIQAVMHLMGRIVNFSELSKTYTEMHYTDKNGNQLNFGCESLLSAGIVDAKVNGQVMEGVIYFKGDSPLFRMAESKSQIIRYPHELLNVPNLNNTPRIITIKKYVMRRICEIKLHKQLIPTITFDDVFKKARMENSPRNVKMDARNAIVKFFEHLKEQNFITNFEIVQKKQKFYAIQFQY